MITIKGKILRKKKREVYLVMNLLPENEERTKEVRVDKTKAPAYLQCNAIVEATGEWKDNALYTDRITLIKCNPTPAAVEDAIEEVLGGEQPLSILPDGTTMKQIQAIAAIPKGRKKRTAVGNMIRLLEGRRETKFASQRETFVRQSERETLERLETIGNSPENEWKLLNMNQSHATYDTMLEGIPLNVPGDGSQMSIHGSLTRNEYIRNKKLPQILWMIQRLESFPNKDLIRRILDVGGGRGDLATQIARSFPQSHVTVVDINALSLEAGEAYAKELGVEDRMTFIHSDFASFVENYREEPFDLIVALHACGDLSDLAMKFASDSECSFLVCPCCYTKRYIDQFSAKYLRFLTDEESRLLARFAETDDLPDLSQRSMRVINSMRLQTFGDYCVSLEEFDKQISGRNQVLVGTMRND